MEINRAKERLIEGLTEFVISAGANGVVVELDGSLNSTLAACLAVDALGREKVMGLILPCTTPVESIELSTNIAEKLEIVYKVIDLEEASMEFEYLIDESFSPIIVTPVEDVSRNLKARLRTVMLYATANIMKALVIGITDATDTALGLFTKYGENGADCELLATLFKQDVLDMASLYDETIPEAVFTNEALARHKAETNLGSSYDEIESALCDLWNMPIRGGLPEASIETLEKVGKLINKTWHKRAIATPITLEKVD